MTRLTITRSDIRDCRISDLPSLEAMADIRNFKAPVVSGALNPTGQSHKAAGQAIGGGWKKIFGGKKRKGNPKYE